LDRLDARLDSRHAQAQFSLDRMSELRVTARKENAASAYGSFEAQLSQSSPGLEDRWASLHANRRGGADVDTASRQYRHETEIAKLPIDCCCRVPVDAEALSQGPNAWKTPSRRIPAFEDAGLEPEDDLPAGLDLGWSNDAHP
jgi:hypothetical protein